MKINNRGVWCLLVGLLASSVVSAEPLKSKYERFTISVRVTVAADGDIENLKIRGEFDPRIVAHVDRAVRELKLKPAQRNGVPVSAETTMNFITVVEHKAEGGGTAIATRYSGHGPSIAKMEPPKFPTLAPGPRRVRSALVMLDVTISEDGRVADVHSRYSFTPIKGGSVARFESAAFAAARKWRFEVERVDGMPLATSVLVPVTFTWSREDAFELEKIRRTLYQDTAEVSSQNLLALNNATGLTVIE